jgi:PAS domain S-box-containing protein
VPTPRSSRKRTAPLGYIAVIGLILATVGLVLAGYAPLFFDTSGPTLTRQWVIGIDIVFFATSGLLLAWQYLHTRSRVLYWYSLALLTFALALFGAAIYMVPNGFLNWLARIGQYLGGLYFLAAVLSSRMRVEAAAFPENISWTNAFRNDIKLYDTFFENIGSGFAYGQVISKNGNPVDWVYLDVNAAFESMLGKSRKEVIGKKATEVFPLLTTDPVEWIKIYGNVALTGKQKVVENYSQDLQKWYRVFVYSPRRSFFVAIFEDVTERKKAEEALKLAQEKLQEYATGLERLVEHDLHVHGATDAAADGEWDKHLVGRCRDHVVDG